MKKYKHLTLEERELITINKAEGMSHGDIAKKLGRDRRTIDRELKRNTKYFRKYIPCHADRRAQRIATKQRKKAALKSPLIFVYVREKLRDEGWSPETISGRLPIDHPGCSIHHETIYRYIYKPENRQYKLSEYLTLGRKKRKAKNGRHVQRKGRILGAVSIEKRPKGVERRKQLGHWETDNMEGPRSTRAVLSATEERVTRYIYLNKLIGQSARVKTDAVISRIKCNAKRLRKTLTMDNGKENSYHKEIREQTGMRVYFCHAYHSWEKGSVENSIGRVRRYLPKGTNLDEISEETIALIEKKMNNTPRKCLGYLTPSEKMEQLLASS